MDSSITIPIYAAHRDAIAGTGALTSEFLVQSGKAVPLFLGPLADDRLPKDAIQGEELSSRGSVAGGGREGGGQGAVHLH